MDYRVLFGLLTDLLITVALGVSRHRNWITWRVSFQKIIGILIGFSGVVLLLSKDVSADMHNSDLGKASVILASFGYAGSNIYVRRQTADVPGQVRGMLPFFSANAIMWVAAPLLEYPIVIPGCRSSEFPCFGWVCLKPAWL